VVALLPKPPDTLTASVEALSAHPEVRLEEYDERAESPASPKTMSRVLP
jgi:hypothetical protein